MKKILSKEENKILLMLAFFSIGVGLWGNFRQLWLQENNLTVSNISHILSLASLISAICIYISSRKLELSKLKSFINIMLILKIISMLIMFGINSYNLKFLLKLLIIFDVVSEKFIILSIYPLILTIKKDDKLYSKRKLVEYLFRDIGILIGGIFIGKTIFSLNINYNACLLISLLFLIVSMIVCCHIKIKVKLTKTKSLKKLFEDKIIILYLLDYIFSNIAIYSALGLKMLMLTNQLNFSASLATNCLLIIGLLADIFGIIALKYFTPKNDYITLTIKFGIRGILYLLAFIINKPSIILLAMFWSIFISTAYENKTDGVYINSVANEYQLFFTDMRYMVGIASESLGLFLAGITYKYGINIMLGLSAIFVLIQLIIAYILIYLRNNKRRLICKKQKGIKYKTRKCVYAILYDDNGNIAITNDGKYFFFGGGIEKKESDIEALKREMIEETGYLIKDIKLHKKLVSYEYNSQRGYLKIVANIYFAKFDQKIKEPIEKDHPIIWNKPIEFIDKMYHEYQRVLLRELSKQKKISINN